MVACRTEGVQKRGLLFYENTELAEMQESNQFSHKAGKRDW